MKSFISRFTFMATLLLAASNVSAFAQSTTTLKIHTESAVAVPGKVLQPGDYVFRIPDSVTGANSVQILSADGKTSIGFVPIYNTQRTRTVDSVAFTTVPDASGLSRIDSWFLRGSQEGFRFIYSNSDLRKIDTIAQKLQAADAQAGN